MTKWAIVVSKHRTATLQLVKTAFAQFSHTTEITSIHAS